MYSSDKFYISHYTHKDNLKHILNSFSLQPLQLQKELLNKDNPDNEFTSEYFEDSKERGDPEKYKRSIFYSILFPDNDGIPIFDPQVPGMEVYFIFSSKIVEDNANMVGTHDITEVPIFCKGWNYGKINSDKCISYDLKKSLEQNLNNWRDSIKTIIEKYHENNKIYSGDYMSVMNGTLGSELLMEGEMPIELDLLHIYVPHPTIQIQMAEVMLSKMPNFQKIIDNYKKQEEEIEIMIKKYDHLPWTRQNPLKN